MSDSDSTVSILDYAEEELAEAKRLQAEEDAAAAELKRIDKAIHEAELAFYQRKEETKRPDRRRVLAEAALAGVEAPPEAPISPGPAVEDLQATIDGLEAFRKAAEDRKASAHGAVRVAVIAAFQEGAQRAAADYLETAKALEQLHAAIGAAQAALGAITGGQPALVGPDWNDLNVPNSGGLTALAGAGVVKGAAYLRLPVAGGHLCHENAQAAFVEAQAEIRRRLGGRWPFGRG